MRHFIDTLLEPALWFAVDWSLRWAALLALATLFLWVFRPRRATIRQVILLVTLIAGLLLPFAPRWGDGWQLNNPHEPSASSTTSSPAVSPSAWERTSGRSAAAPTTGTNATRSIAPVRSHTERGNEKEPRNEPLGRRRLIVFSLVSCWSIVAVYQLIRRICGWIFLWRLCHESVEVTGATADLFAACRLETRVRNTVRLGTHPHVQSPILLGGWKPRIIVPTDWPQRDPDCQRAGLFHELAHVRRRDHLLAPLLEIVRIAFFFHPLVRWLLARLEHERELLCDEMVVRMGIDRRAYARLLLEFARSSGRLAWSAVSLPMSRRQTVKGRIYHLLEDDMERWVRPLPARWAVVLGAGLLAVSLGLASYRVWAEEKDKTEIPTKKEKQQSAPTKQEAPSIKRDDLRYGGKNFNQWRKDILTELKGSIRVDGIRAFAAFGVNGYGQEATEAIMEIVRGYDITQNNQSDDDGAVVRAGFQAIVKIGEAALPALSQAVEGRNRNARLFAIEALQEMRDTARVCVPALLNAMKNDDVVTRQNALEAVRFIDIYARGYIPALIEALKDEEPAVRSLAATRLRDKGVVEDAKSAIPALLEALRDKHSNVRWQAIQALNMIGPEKRGVGTVSRLLQDEDANTEMQAYSYLQYLGPDAKGAVPALLAQLKKEPSPVTIETLAKIGPDAKDAIPELTKLLTCDNPDIRSSAMQALKKISPGDRR